ncbi:MAG: hypothetical protein R3E64_12265 [Halioglobus sp.]
MHNVVLAGARQYPPLPAEKMMCVLPEQLAIENSRNPPAGARREIIPTDYQ